MVAQNSAAAKPACLLHLNNDERQSDMLDPNRVSSLTEWLAHLDWEFYAPDIRALHTILSRRPGVYHQGDDEKSLGENLIR
jgi:hypothetical protein